MTTQPYATPLPELLGDLNAGVFAQQIEHAFAETALGVVSTGRKGKVVLTFDLGRIGDSSQVALKHKLQFVCPTNRGKRSEESTTETPLHVGPRGRLSLFPVAQGQLDLRTAADAALPTRTEG